jgi:hypothetical protein
MKRIMNLTKLVSPSGNGGSVVLLTAAAWDVTDLQQTYAAALQTQKTLHSPSGKLLIIINPWVCKRS